MLRQNKLNCLFGAAAICSVLSAAIAGGQDLVPVSLEAVTTGVRPLGVDITAAGDTSGNPRFAAVANSGDNSVSIFELNLDRRTSRAILVPRTTVQQVPSPYSVTFCRHPLDRDSSPVSGDRLVVTSPSDGSISVVQVPQGILLGTVKTGPKPYSVTCFSQETGSKAVVSNLGDNTLVVVDLNSLAVEARIPDVPGSRGLRGIRMFATRQGNLIAWVAGTDANVVTLVELGSARIINRIPVRGPAAVGFASTGMFVTSPPENSVLFFNFETLQIESRASNIPNPQNFTNSSLGMFAATGTGNSLVHFKFSSGKVTAFKVISGIPGAAGLADWRFRAEGIYLTVSFGILVTSPDSNSVFLVQPRPGLPAQFTATNGASFSTRDVALGSLASAFVSTGVSQNFSVQSVPLPTTLGGVTLRIGGSLQFINSQWVYSGAAAVPAALLFVGPGQINFQVPPQTSPAEEVIAQLEKPDGTTLFGTLYVTAAAPGIFTVLANGQGPAAVLNQDNSVNMGTRPAPRGSIIQIFATGAGATNPPLASGEAAPISGNPLVLTQVQPVVGIGDRTARVLFSGMAPGLVGVWQINAEVPRDLDSAPLFVALHIIVAGNSSNAATIAVQ